MAMKPVIGITLDYNERKANAGGYSDKPWYALRVNYVEAVNLNGGLVILLPYIEQDIDSYLEICDGLLIPGGDYDINPEYYGEKACKHTNSSSGIREDFEIKLLRRAMDLEMPILGICAGEQLLNVMAGGTLIQHIPDVTKSKITHKHHGDQDLDWHEVNIMEGSLLSKIVGVPNYKVNSHHHQAVEKVGQNFVVNAVALDGVIEGIEHTTLPFCLGVEWHPEHCKNEGDRKIIKAFIQAAAKFHSSRK
jgi:putative glutamine amidotransferase